MHRQQSVRKRWSTALNREVTATIVGHKVLNIQRFKRGARIAKEYGYTLSGAIYY